MVLSQSQYQYIYLIICLSVSGIFQGDYSVVLASPESLVLYDDELADDRFPGSICCLAVDEVHNVVDWKTFRPVYANLSDMKTIIAGNAPWALCTATCDKELKEGLLKSLNIQEIELVCAVPDR